MVPIGLNKKNSQSLIQVSNLFHQLSLVPPIQTHISLEDYQWQIVST